VVDEASITSRLVDFFSAYRNAMLKGVKNSEDGRPSVDFSDISATGAASGVQGTKDGKVKAPTDDDVARLLGKAR
jgi:hypothetical protein